jgi:hypothetical protein
MKSAQLVSKKAFIAAIAAVTMFIGMMTAMIAFAPTSGAATQTYNTLRACQSAQRSMGHNSSIRITEPCYSYRFNCYGNQCQIAYAFSWEYRKIR